MTHWSMRVDVAGAIREDEAERVVGELGGALGINAETQRTTVQFGVEATTVRQAADEGLRRARAVLDGEPVGLQVRTYEDLKAEIERPQVPKLVGIAEIAEILGVSKQRAGELANKHPDFPPAVQRLAAGPVFVESMVEAFNARWERRRTGRPPKP